MSVSRHRRVRRHARHARRPASVLDPESRLIDTEAQRLAHVGSWQWDAVRDVVTWTEELYRIYGLARGEFAGTYEGFLRHVHPDDRDYTREVIARAFRESQSFSYDHRIVRPDGAVRMLQTRGDVVRHDGVVVRLVGCCMDVTEQWETRLRLDESRALLQATLDSTEDGIIVVDLAGKVVTLNKRALELWGVPEALATRGDLQAMIEFVAGQLEDPESFVARERELQQKHEIQALDRIAFKDGRVFDRYTQPQRVKGRIVGRVCSFRDVTERERALGELKKSAADLEERVRLRTEDLCKTSEELARSNAELEIFASAASHDLNAPARKISSLAQLLEMRAAGKLGEQELQMLGRIRKAAADMTRLITDVLALARASREALALERVELDHVATDVLSDLEVALAESGGAVDFGPLPAVRGHEILWRRLFQNLISNALKFRSVGRAPKVAVRCKNEPEGGATISVEDNGIGFDPRFAQAIFLPFRRLNPASEYEGSGLGLATCERIVRRYGGTITAQGEPGKGATFLIRLPPSALA